MFVRRTRKCSISNTYVPISTKENKENYLNEINDRIENLTQYSDLKKRMITCEKNRKNLYYVYFEQCQIINDYQWKLNDCKYVKHDWVEEQQFEMEDESFT